MPFHKFESTILWVLGLCLWNVLASRFGHKLSGAKTALLPRAALQLGAAARLGAPHNLRSQTPKER
eukprot:1817149-Amphidinium_carterae.1